MSNHLFQLVYPGDPKGQARPRAAMLPGMGGGKVRMHSPKSEWFNGLKIYASTCQPATLDPELPLSATISCFFRRPKAHFRKDRKTKELVLKENAPRRHVGKPDVDNLAKSVLDALVQGGVLPDDKQVCECVVSKLYGEKVETVITIREVFDPYEVADRIGIVSEEDFMNRMKP